MQKRFVRGLAVGPASQQRFPIGSLRFGSLCIPNVRHVLRRNDSRGIGGFLIKINDMTTPTENIIKIMLAVLFFLCLADLPYGFFQLVRFCALVGFGILAYAANEKKQSAEVIVYVALAILFQPLFKIALGRTIWNSLDIVIGVALLLSIFIKPKLKTDK